MTSSSGKGNASLIIHSTDSIMVYPLVTTQGKKKQTNEQCSAVQNVKEMRSEASPKTQLLSDSLDTTPRKTPYLHGAELRSNGITSVELCFHHGDDLGVSLSSCERTPLTSLFFFQNFNPRSRLRERDSLRAPPRRSSLRGDGLLAPSLSPLAMRDTGSGDVSPL